MPATCDTANGSFTQEDPKRDQNNWYSYCGGDPVNHVDPTGEAFFKKLWNGIKTVATKAVGAVTNVAVKAATAAKTFYTKHYDTIQKVTKVASVALAAIAICTVIGAAAGVAAAIATGASITTATATLTATGVGLSASLSGITGGIHNEQKGGSYFSGWVGGAVSGTIQSSATAIGAALDCPQPWIVMGGAFGSGVGTAVTEVVANALDRTVEQQVSGAQIISSSIKSAAAASVTSLVTAGFYGYMHSDNVEMINLVGGRFFTHALSILEREEYMAFFGAVDDYGTYMIADFLETWR